MHVAGELCKNLFINLDLNFDKEGNLSTAPVVQNKSSNVKYFSLKSEIIELDNELKALWSLHSNPTEWHHDLGKFNVDIMGTLSKRIPGPYPERYLWGFAVMRLCGLLHDIGHLPYSHTSETALIEYMREVSRNNKNSIESRILERIDSSNLSLHEHLGSLILADLERFHEKIPIKSLTRLLVLMSNRVLFTKQFPILHSMVSGPIDADRIDYIRRDSEASGFQKSGADYSRIFNSIGLVHFEGEVDPQMMFKNFQKHPEKHPDHILVTPGSRATSDIEKLLRERFQAYRHIYNHHKVRLFDLILTRCVVHLAKQGKFLWLIERLDAAFFPSSDALDDDEAPYQPIDEDQKEIEKMKQTYVDDKEAFYANLRSLEIQMTDGWLEQEVRSLWNKALSIDPKALRMLKIEEWWLLTGIRNLVEDRTRFKTGFRSPKEFWEEMAVVIKPPENIEEAIQFRKNLNFEELSIRTRILETVFLEEGIFVLFGVQNGPESIGANKIFLNKFELAERCADLTRLTYQSPFINFWFFVRDEKKYEKTRKKIVAELIKVIKQRLTLGLDRKK